MVLTLSEHLTKLDEEILRRQDAHLISLVELLNKITVNHAGRSVLSIDLNREFSASQGISILFDALSLRFTLASNY